MLFLCLYLLQDTLSIVMNCNSGFRLFILIYTFSSLSDLIHGELSSTLRKISHSGSTDDKQSEFIEPFQHFISSDEHERYTKKSIIPRHALSLWKHNGAIQDDETERRSTVAGSDLPQLIQYSDLMSENGVPDDLAKLLLSPDIDKKSNVQDQKEVGTTADDAKVEENKTSLSGTLLKETNAARRTMQLDQVADKTLAQKRGEFYGR